MGLSNASEACNGSSSSPTKPKPYNVNVSLRFIYGSLLTSVLLAFTVGRTARIVLIDSQVKQILATHDMTGQIRLEEKGLPNPKLIEGKEVPRTLYTAKNFDTAIGSSSTSMYLERDADHEKNKASAAEKSESSATSFCQDENGEKQCSRGLQANQPIPNNEAGSTANATEEEHLPAGQHLLVDIKNVDGNFLNSEQRLAEAMVSVVNESKLTLLSYHCHKLVPMGVSCVGVLLESHISFHTWPEEGVITLDLFTCGSGELVPVLPILKRLFAIPQPSAIKTGNELPETVWSHKLRGYSANDNPLGNDLGSFVLESTHFDLKKEVATKKTKFQRIDIYDTIDATTAYGLSYTNSLSNDGSYESLHPELFLPEREIYLDGVLQSTRNGNEAYHEALVHPALFAHPNPKKVGIIGGGEGATLREVLKHNTIEKVKMIEIDEEMVSFCRQHLPDWNTCADLEGSTEWCGDDERAEIYYEDGLAWFNNRFSDDGRIDTEEFKEDPFDILIMDALDPQDDVPFADMLYTNKVFIKTLYNALSDDGIIIMQLGASPDSYGPAESLSIDSKRDFVMKMLEELGFNGVHVYEEGRCMFRSPWSFAVAMKGDSGNSMWRRSAAEIDIAIHKRILRTKSGKPALQNFDGSLMSGYMIPPKSFETVYCRAVPTPGSCLVGNAQTVEDRRLYDPHVDRMNIGLSSGDVLDYFQKVTN